MTETLFPLGIVETVSLFKVLLAITALLALIMIPALISSNKPLQVGQAAYYYLMKAFGLSLIGLSLFTILLHLLTGSLFPIEPHFGVLLTFAVGALIVLTFHKLAMMLDPAASLVIKTIFLFGFQTLGFIMMTFSGLCIGVHLLRYRYVIDWEVPVSILIIGILTTLVFSQLTTAAVASKHTFIATILKPKRKK